MDKNSLENLDEQALFNLQHSISEIIKDRNLQKGDLEAIIEEAFSVAFPRLDSVGLNPWVDGSLIVCPGARIDKSQVKHTCKFVVADRKSTRLNSSHSQQSRMPSSA